jgi:hypothetical protein
MLTLLSGSIVSGMDFNGNLGNVVQGTQVTKTGIYINSEQDVLIKDCDVCNFIARGIDIKGSTRVSVRDCLLNNFGKEAVRAENSPRTRVIGCKISHATGDGIALINSPQSLIALNAVGSCGLIGYGINASDSDNTLINGNNIQQCAFGLLVAFSSQRSLQSCGMAITGNVIIRNYVSGVKFVLAPGFDLSSNTISSNGQAAGTAAAGDIVVTIEPGIALSTGAGGTGYVLGDVLTLVGGTGTPARAVVTRVLPGGNIASDGIHPVTLGDYSVFPSAVATVSGGSGTGAQLVYSGSRIVTPGTGYVVGEVLRATNNTFNNPARIAITAIDGVGGVTGYEVLDGGGYYQGPSHPWDNFLWTSESLSDNQGLGSGLVVQPASGDRYRQQFLGLQVYGVETLGSFLGGTINGNVITKNNGIGLIIAGSNAPYDGRATYLAFYGNSLVNNIDAVKGLTIGNTPDDNHGIALGTSVIYPPPPGP